MKAYEWFKFILKYGLFALCVLGVNKFRRYHIDRWRRRQRLSSSTSSTDSDDTFTVRMSMNY